MSTSKANETPKKPRKTRNKVSKENQEVSENVGKHQGSVKSDEIKPKLGRPTKFSQELADHICERISEGESLRSVCRDPDIPPAGTILRWVAQNSVFREQYDAAMEQRAEYLFEEMFEIADETQLDTIETETGERPNAEWISRSRLRVDVRKWALSKMMPKKYGDRIQHANDPDNPLLANLSEEDLGRRIAQLEFKIKGGK